MKYLFLLCVITSALIGKPVNATEDIALCGKMAGWTHYHAGSFVSEEGTGWQKDSVSKGKTALKKISENDYDILYLDATGGVFSSKQDGSKIFKIRSFDKDAAFIVIGAKGEIEFYNFYMDSKGSLKMDWAQNKGQNLLISKSTLMTANCSMINFKTMQSK